MDLYIDGEDEAQAVFTGTLDKLEVASGDVLVLRTSTHIEQAVTFAESLKRVLYARSLDDVMILVLAPTTELEALSRDDMERRGWVRRDAPAQMLASSSVTR